MSVCSHLQTLPASLQFAFPVALGRVATIKNRYECAMLLTLYGIRQCFNQRDPQSSTQHLIQIHFQSLETGTPAQKGGRGERGLGQGLRNRLEIHCSHTAKENSSPSFPTPRSKNAAFSLSLFWSHFLVYTQYPIPKTTNKSQNVLKEIIFTRIHWTWVSI